MSLIDLGAASLLSKNHMIYIPLYSVLDCRRTTMKISPRSAVSLFLCLCIYLCFSLSVSLPTTLTYFTEHVVERAQDYIQMQLQIKVDDASLKEALAKTQKIMDSISKLVKDDCNKNKKDCSDVVEIGQFEVEPKYQIIRKQPVFVAFIVSYEMTLRILHIPSLPQLTDKLIAIKQSVVESIQWKSFAEGQHELQAIKQGLEEGEKRCKNLKGVLGQVKQIEQMVEFEEEEQEEQESGQTETQPEEEEEQVILYKFVVECIDAKKKKGRK